MKELLWHNLEPQQALRELASRIEGLPWAEVKKRQAQYGPNELPKPRKLTSIKLFGSQFKSPLIVILLIAAVVSLVLRDVIDTVVILAAVWLNVVVGWAQESKAQKGLVKLRAVVSLEAKVRRQGKVEIVPASELVPGDIVLLSAGDKVPADGRLLAATELQTNEASLTGESAPVKKQLNKLEKGVVINDRTNMAFMGTVIVNGLGEMAVTAVGAKTELGKIAYLLKAVREEDTPLQKKLSRLAKLIGTMVLIFCFLLFLAGILAHRSFITMFTTAVAVAVSAIPEGLGVGVTVVLAVGMQRLLKHRGLVRKLLAAETLGSTSVICVDKTGTLTRGEMQVVEILTAGDNLELTYHKRQGHKIEEHQSFRFALELACLNNDAQIANPDEAVEQYKIWGSPTEKALLLSGLEHGFNHEKLNQKYPRLAEIPFDSEGKYMATLHHYSADKNLLAVKGAPEKIIALSTEVDINGRVQALSSVQKDKLIKQFEALSQKGLRLLSLAYNFLPTSIVELEANAFESHPALVFVGFLALKDPLRPEVKDSVLVAQQAGAQVVMLTGDHRLTAKAIAAEVGLEVKADNILSGTELGSLSDEQLKKRITAIKVFARVSPSDKLRIIKAWQARGEVVAMTGDGVNDAPALKAADIGVALGSGTEVAKETADLVLLDNSFTTIIKAIEQGRVIYDNIKKIILYLLSNSFAEMLVVIVSLLLGWPLPLTAAQILWINLADDSLPNMALTLEPGEKEVMREKPVNRTATILTGEMKFLIGAVSVIIGFFTLGIFYYFWRTTGSVDLARTAAFMLLGLSSLFYVFSTRSMRQPLWRVNLFSNPWLVLAVLGGLILQLAAVYLPFLQRAFHTVPLPGNAWLMIMVACILVMVFIELSKLVFRQQQIKFK